MPNLNIRQQLYQRYWQFISRYLDKRQSAADKVTLVQKLIFILPTRYGWWFLLLIILLYLLGTNYQNNLILLLGYLLLSLFLLSIVLTYQNMSGLMLQCQQAAEGFAGTKIAPVISLSSGKTHFMLQFSLVQQHDVVLLSQPAAAVTLGLTATKRGRYPLPRVKISSQYPFGLWRAWSYIALAQYYWVYPAPDGSKVASNTDGNDTGPTKTDTGTTLAPYRSGDSLRHLVWKRLARDPANPVVRQQHFTAQTTLGWVVVPALSGDALERALSHACQQLLLLEQSGTCYGLKLPTQTLPQSSGPLHLQRCLQELALC